MALEPTPRRRHRQALRRDDLVRDHEALKCVRKAARFRRADAPRVVRACGRHTRYSHELNKCIDDARNLRGRRVAIINACGESTRHSHDMRRCHAHRGQRGRLRDHRRLRGVDLLLLSDAPVHGELDEALSAHFLPHLLDLVGVVGIFVASLSNRVGVAAATRRVEKGGRGDADGDQSAGAGGAARGDAGGRVWRRRRREQLEQHGLEQHERQ